MFSYIFTAIFWIVAFFAPIQTSAASLVELYTSQGCSTCPRADLYVADLNQRDDVIALSFHVDYWDYLGWEDTMASPAFSERQVRYQQARQEKQIFTPQFIVNGRNSFSGSNTKAIENSFKISNASPDINMTISDNGQLSFSAFPSDGKQYKIMLAWVIPAMTVEITSGENKGKLIEYTNVVNNLQNVAKWNGLSAITIDFAQKEDLNLVAFIQEEELGEIVFAEKIPN